MQISRFQTQGNNLVRRTVEHARDLLKILSFFADGWSIFKFSAGIRILKRERHSEIIGIKMPWKSISLFCHIDDDIR
ncbi:MAG: hypothetical protein EB086_12325 [Rhodobacteraceae bacterium]|nr:hypothetical protein [Paracoccaceae bacterium]